MTSTISENELENNISVTMLVKAAEQGDARAQYKLGNCYQIGTGVEKNEQKAVEWYQKATKQGYAGAQYNLGVGYQCVIGVEKDEQKTAEQGDATAQNSLGVCYQYGTG